MQIIDVSKQLARHPDKVYSKRPLDVIKYIVIHHSATSEGDAFSFARHHVNVRGWPGIGYHYVILEDGTIQKTNDLSTISYHTRGYNTTSIGICLVGDFSEKNLENAQKIALGELCQELFPKLKLEVSGVKGHNELVAGATQCPALDMEEVRVNLQNKAIKIYFENNLLNVPAYLENDTTFVAVRSLLEQMGYKVEWDGDNYRINVFKGESEELNKLKKERDYYFSLLKQIKDIVSEV